MQSVDLLGAFLVVTAFAAFALGCAALASSHDVAALYWIGVGAIAARAALQVAREIS